MDLHLKTHESLKKTGVTMSEQTKSIKAKTYDALKTEVELESLSNEPEAANDYLPGKQKHYETFFNMRYVDTSDLSEKKGVQTSMRGTTAHKNKNLQQAPHKDVIVPFSALFDPLDYAIKKSLDPQKIAVAEKPKLSIPPDVQLNSKGSTETTKPTLEEPNLTEKSNEKSGGILHRFIDWVTGFFKKKNKGVGLDDPEWLRDKLESPTQRNAEAIRDCLKKLNQTLERMRNLEESDMASGEAIEEAAGTAELIKKLEEKMAKLFALYIEIIKKSDEYKQVDIALTHKDMLDAQEGVKEANKKYFEALHETLWVGKFSKWMKVPETIATAATIAAFGIAGAIIVAGVATGGLASLVGVLGTAFVWFGIAQGVSFVAQGFSKGARSVINQKINSHTAQMAIARNEQDKLTLAIQEDMRVIIDAINEISKMWEMLSHISLQQISTVKMFKNQV